ncbi:nicotinate-nucleotide adenylyltransferase [Salirhabdus sp. Marseille-P4669]|uniref:nicotinate-nucleotide adenylyltransferase n=1 Tax=Salirhabdus sp. Marseille-P4669 TaxID=2042310 RepID=UPI000C7A916D|nr:nicotinate-nucleotide adenylyltransferase [Salirhabdus sp. Marseille-P4669]
MKKIGLFGGTFDPIHVGHLLMAEEVYERLNLDEIWFIPSYVPPHKTGTTTSPDDRMRMLQLATEDNDHFRIEDMELKRKGTSFTFDTIEQLKQSHPDKQFLFIIGADMVEYLPKWYKIEELIHNITFVGVKRVGYEVKSKYPIIEVEVPMIEISSTILRNRLKHGGTTRYWLPKKVREYIRENGLYES